MISLQRNPAFSKQPPDKPNTNCGPGYLCGAGSDSLRSTPQCLANAPGSISPNNIYADGTNTGNTPGRAGANIVKNTITE